MIEQRDAWVRDEAPGVTAGCVGGAGAKMPVERAPIKDEVELEEKEKALEELPWELPLFSSRPSQPKARVLLEREKGVTGLTSLISSGMGCSAVCPRVGVASGEVLKRLSFFRIHASTRFKTFIAL